MMRRAVYLLGLGLIACSAGPSDAGRSAPEVRAATPLPDTPLLRLLRRAVATCEVSDSGSFNGCEDGYRFFDDIGALEFEDLHAALALECRLLAERDPELAQLALARIAATTLALKRGGRISEAADDALLTCLRERLDAPGVLDPGVLVAEYTEFSIGLGRDEAILAYLGGLTDPRQRIMGYRSLWRFADMRLWPTLKRLIADAEPDTAAAVLAGLDGEDLAEEHERTLCTDIAGWLHDPRAPVQELAASHVAYRCARYHPELLAEVRARLARGEIDRSHVLSVGHLAEHCVEVGAETCEEAAALLESIALTTSVKPYARALALSSVARHDREKGRALAQRLRGDGDPEVAESAASLLSQ